MYVCVLLALFLASTSACSFPVIWQCPGIHCSAICLCFPLSCRIRSWQSLASVDILVSVDAVDSIAAFESQKITTLSNLLWWEVQHTLCSTYGFDFSIEGSRMLSQWHVAGENFTVDASSSVYVSSYLPAICEDVQPLVLGVPGVHCFQSQVSKCFCLSLCYVLLQV